MGGQVPPRSRIISFRSGSTASLRRYNTWSRSGGAYKWAGHPFRRSPRHQHGLVSTLGTAERGMSAASEEGRRWGRTIGRGLGTLAAGLPLSDRQAALFNLPAVDVGAPAQRRWLPMQLSRAAATHLRLDVVVVVRPATTLGSPLVL